MQTGKRLIIIDSNALIHRAYHALPPLTTKSGEVVNAVYGFLLAFFKALKELKPDYLVAAFDVSSPTFRHKKFQEYKAKRKKAPQELYNQIPKVKEVLEAFNVPVFEKEGFEADDIIGTIAKKAAQKIAYPNPEVIILTGDMDALQLVDENTKVFTFRKGIKDSVLYDEKMVRERYGVLPNQMVDFRGLKGDPSDNISGVPGIGEKTAAKLIQDFGTMEAIYDDIEKHSDKSKKIPEKIKEKLIQFKEQAFFSKFLSQIDKNSPVDFQLKDALWEGFDEKIVGELLKKLEFFSLIPKLSDVHYGGGKKANKSPATLFEDDKGENLAVELERLFGEGSLSKEIYQIEKELMPVVKVMEENGIKVDFKKLSGLSKKLERKLKELESKIYKISGQKFNINSSQQLSEILFTKLNLPVQGLKKTPGGVVSTSWTELEKLRDKHQIIQFLGDYRESFKLKTGFIDSLPRLIKKDGRIHPMFKQLGAATGRFSCHNPNLQNIPVKGEIGKEIRKAFVSENGFSLVSADYSQMELRVAAVISKDNKMLDFFKQGKDVHKMTASQIFNIPEEKVGDKERSIAKTINFGVLYGMGIVGLAAASGISRPEAKRFIDEYFKDFRGIASYVSDSIEKARESSFSHTLFGRKRFLPEINSTDFRIRQAAERMAINHPVQGTSADIIKMAMVEISKKLPISGKNCRLLLQVHDELLFEIKKDSVFEEAKKIKKIMEGVVDFEVPLTVEVQEGESWGELKDVML